MGLENLFMNTLTILTILRDRIVYKIGKKRKAIFSTRRHIKFLREITIFRLIFLTKGQRFLRPMIVKTVS